MELVQEMSLLTATLVPDRGTPSVVPDDIWGQWAAVCQELATHLTDKFSMHWIEKLTPDKIVDARVFLYAPSPCIQELIQKNYMTCLLAAWQKYVPNIQEIILGLNTGESVAPTPVPTTDTKEQTFPCGTEVVNTTSPAHYIGNLNANYTFDSFVVGKPNEFAFAAAKRVAEDDRVLFNPLYFQSAPGLGKTHLMQAMAWRMQELYPRKTVVYLSCEQFVNRYVRSLQDRNTTDFQDLFRSVDVLMIDDIQFICGKKASQTEFFNTFNELIAQGRQIVLSADTSPQDLQGIEERLKTRLAHGLVVDIKPTSYELRLGILNEKLKLWHAPHVPEEVLDFLARRIVANVRELEGALKRIIAHAELVGGHISLETTKEVLQDILGTYERPLDISDIQNHVANYYHLTLADLKSTRRERTVARPRQIAMYLAKIMTTFSLPDIATKFDRDHSTILHAVKTIEKLMQTDAMMMADLTTLKKQLNARKNA